MELIQTYKTIFYKKFFFLFLFTFFKLNSVGYADEIAINGKLSNQVLMDLNFFKSSPIKSSLFEELLLGIQEDVDFCENRMKFHLRKGQEAFAKAEEICIYLPESTREIVYELIEATVEASIGMWLGGYYGLVGTLVVKLTQYGIFIDNNNRELKEALENSMSHYEMYLYYYKKKESLI